MSTANQNAPYSESNIRLKPSFQPNKRLESNSHVVSTRNVQPATVCRSRYTRQSLAIVEGPLDAMPDEILSKAAQVYELEDTLGRPSVDGMPFLTHLGLL